MRVRSVRLFIMFACIAAAAATASAQFGHPLKGTWSGDWGPNKDTRNRVLLHLDWDGKEVTGSINPGPNAVQFQKVTVDPSTWLVRFEGEGKDRAGATVKYVIDGKMENIGAYARFITGTWTQGSQKGDFKVTRN